MKNEDKKHVIYIRKQQRKVIFICFFLFFIPFIALVSYLGIKDNQNVKEDYTTSREELNTQLQLSFDNILMSIRRISYLHLSDVKIEKILLRHYGTKGIQYVEDNIYMNTLTSNLLQINPLFYGITFISRDGEVFGSVNSTEENKKYVQETIQWMNENDLNTYVSPQSKRNVMFREKLLFSSLTRLVDYSKNTVGYLLIDIDFRDIQTIIDSVDPDTSSILLTGTDSILTSNETEFRNKDAVANKIYEQLENDLSGLHTSLRKEITVDGKRYMCLLQPVTSIGASIIQYYENPNYFADFFENWGMAFLVCLALMILVLFIISRNSSRISGSIETLILAMKETGKGNLQQIDASGNIYELNLIMERYNKMVTQLERAIKENYVSKINQKNIELKMLQAQINPHFIYNTLNLISSMAILNDVEEISGISDKLSSILRYNIKKGDIVLVQDELKQVEDYLYIQRIRFSGSIKENFDIDEELLGCSIIKFLIQPLVENCIFHGLELKKEGGEIRICVKKEGEDMIVTVSDNGVGMEKDQLDYLQEEIRKVDSFALTAKDEASIGIRNVASRIRTYYGEAYGLTVESEPGEGTSFLMRLPVYHSRV